MTNVEHGGALTRSSVDAHWASVSAQLSRLMQLMDSREPWVEEPDGEFLELLEQFTHRIEQPEFALVLERGENAARLAEIFAVLHSSRFMRLIELFDRQQPGIVSRMLLAISQIGGTAEAFSRLLHERLLTVHSCELLGQVISQKRCTRIIEDIKLIQELNQ
ncbi:hypothetical protein VQ574_21415 (plasmid) [Stutzerimonas frequens]|uniref:type IVB secretion system protein IcmW n=1 Tax=Stutzerimonas frequens TaxID=2968969 RepID=UPI002DB7B4A0|nr:hypothetical protein [Stutzerimonas frequens]WRW29286.1 hypothetical protein VQ574_21415 [Stutzerimonas frequens]